MKGEKITWSVPFGAHKEVALAEIRTVFPAMAFVRMGLLISAIYLGVRFALIRKWPEIEVDWVILFLICMGSLFMLPGMACLAALVPPRITVKTKGILVNRGQNAYWHFYKDMASIRIDEDAKPFPFLRISFLPGRPDVTYPIAPQVSLEALRLMIERCRFGSKGAVDREAT